MKLITFGMLGLVVLTACGGGLSTPEQRSAALCSASLKVIRAEHLVMAGKLEMDAADLDADSAFHHVVGLGPDCVGQWVNAGESSCSDQLRDFVKAAGRIPDHSSPDDPASALRKVLTEAPESSSRVGPLFDGYAAAFQLCLEVERDGTLMQDFLPVLVAAGCPLTLNDLGLNGLRSNRLQELADKATIYTDEMPYPTAAENYYITFIKLNNWASKFSGQVTADTLAARLLDSEGSERVIWHLSNKGAMKIGFLGDSQMDRIHWSTQAPFPDIVAAVLRRINPQITVINAGRGGDDSGEALARIDTDLLAYKPDITFVMLGGNDAQHWGGPDPAVTPEQYRKNINEIVRRCRQAGSRVVLMSYPLGGDLKGENFDTFTKICEQLKQAADSLGTSWLDVAKILDAEPPETVFAVDLIHFNPTTHIKLAGMVLARLAAMESTEELKK